MLLCFLYFPSSVFSFFYLLPDGTFEELKALPVVFVSAMENPGHCLWHRIPSRRTPILFAHFPGLPRTLSVGHYLCAQGKQLFWLPGDLAGPLDRGGYFFDELTFGKGGGGAEVFV